MINCPPKVLSAEILLSDENIPCAIKTYQNDIKLMLKHKTDKNLLTLALSVSEKDWNEVNLSGSLFDL